MERHLLSCTFCKRSEKQVRKLDSGPGVYICDRCTERAHAIVHEDAPRQPRPALLQRARFQLRRLVMFRAGRNERRRTSWHAV